MSNGELLAEQAKWMAAHTKPLHQWLAEAGEEALAQAARIFGTPETFHRRFLEEVASLPWWRREIVYYR